MAGCHSGLLSRHFWRDSFPLAVVTNRCNPPAPVGVRGVLPGFAAFTAVIVTKPRCYAPLASPENGCAVPLGAVPRRNEYDETGGISGACCKIMHRDVPCIGALAEGVGFEPTVRC
jgi:hypothetical protein